MKKTLVSTLQLILLITLLMGFNFLSSCGPDAKEARIEDTEGGLELLEREFGECEEVTEDDNIPQYLRRASDFERRNQNQNTYPHAYASLGEMYPMRGTFRQSKDEILDIVDRYIWSQERGVKKLLDYFDMVLLLNVAARDSNDPENSSAQRMQVFVRNGNSNNIEDWDLIHTWPISSGIPCGKKIATFTGVYKFNPDRIYRRYYSQLFDDADMFETMFLYHQYQNGNPTGVAIHGTYATTSLGRKDSGGCVRLHRDNSQCLYETIMGERSSRCLDGGHLNYWGRVPSFMPRYGEADPEYLDANGRLEVNGIKVLVAIFNEKEDRL